jgi:hypothetical protein
MALSFDLDSGVSCDRDVGFAGARWAKQGDVARAGGVSD